MNLSHTSEIRLPLLWIALLRDMVKASLGATTGVETSDEIIKYLLAGADVVMTTSALLRKGPAYVATLVAGLEAWMEEHGFRFIDEMRGIMSHAKVNDPQPYERANYIKTLESY